ncbi:hypothetical protein GCM10020000_52250 [Streptomyces olivoverticillatus]
MAAAYRRAGITAERVSFIEAHGTGTVLGDTIECAALGTVHGIERKEPCAIGSVKGNLGHTEGAAGIAGLIKVALALHHRIVPASRFADRENPQLRLAERGLRLLKSPLRLPPGHLLRGRQQLRHGRHQRPRRPGLGPPGTPASGCRSEAPRRGCSPSPPTPPEALRRNLAAQAEAVAGRPRGDAAALCLHSNRVKTGLPYRYATTARDTAELAAALRRRRPRRCPSRSPTGPGPSPSSPSSSPARAASSPP